MTHSSQQSREASPQENIGSPFAMMGDFFGSPLGPGSQQQRPPSPPNGHPQEGPSTMYDQMFTGLFGNVMAGERRQAPFPQQRGVSEDFLKNLPQKDASKENADCYICLEKCKDGEESCQLPCGHAFDKACIEQWIKTNNSCPVCRTKLD